MCFRILLRMVHPALAFACEGYMLAAEGPAGILACHAFHCTAESFWRHLHLLATLAGERLLTMRMRCRAHYPGECSASECSLMCNDFLRLNYTSIVVDPGVRLAYATDAAELPFAASVVEAPVTSWADILADPIDEAMAIKRPLYQCVPLQPHSFPDRVLWMRA